MAGDWSIVPLSELVTSERRISYGIVQPGHHDPFGVPIVRVSDIRDGRVSTEGALRVSHDIEKSFLRTRLEGGELLITLVGTVGQTVIAPPVLAGWNLARAVGVVPISSDIGVRWVDYVIRAPTIQDLILARVNTTVQTTLNLADLAAFPIPVPPKHERDSIVALLGSLDDKIELNRRMASTLDEMARALFKSWFVDFDPVRAKAKGHPTGLPAATAALFPSRLSDDGLPDGWASEPMLDQAHWVNGAAYKDMHFSDSTDALPVVKIAELKNGLANSTKWTNTDLGGKYRITDGELLFAWSGSPDTSIDTFIWVNGEAWLNQHIFAVRTNGRTSSALLYAMLKFYKPDLIEIARDKQTTGLGHVTRQDLNRLKVNIGNKTVRSAFNKFVEPTYQRLQGVLRETQTLATLRDTLLPKLISGELRIKDAKNAVEAA
jgi:type I restriction enzyme, S subunit